MEEFCRGQNYRGLSGRQAAAEIAQMMGDEYHVAIDDAIRAQLREHIRRRDA